MWVWNKARRIYYCKECLCEVRWSRITRQGFCDCMVFKPNSYLVELPSENLNGEFQKRNQEVKQNETE